MGWWMILGVDSDPAIIEAFDDWHTAILVQSLHISQVLFYSDNQIIFQNISTAEFYKKEEDATTTIASSPTNYTTADNPAALATESTAFNKVSGDKWL